MQRVKWPTIVLLAIFCIYRIRIFVPSGLDSPNTIRPYLYAPFLQFLVSHPGVGEQLAAFTRYCIIALSLPLILALIHYYYGRFPSDPPAGWRAFLYSHRLLFGAIAVSLIVCRFPALVQSQLNADESGFVTASHQLFKDPLFFRSAECGTSGPLNIYPLMLPAIFGISPDYASTRLIGLLVIFLSLWLFYRALRLVTSDALARLATVLATVFFATFKEPDFLHYSSEHIPILLCVAALFVTVRVLTGNSPPDRGLLGIGLLGGAAFLAKMQSVPIVLACALVAMAWLWTTTGIRRLLRPALFLAAGLAALLVVNGVICAATGVWYDFWMSYIVSNRRYPGDGKPLAEGLKDFAGFVFGNPQFSFLIFLVLALLATRLYRWTRPRSAGDAVEFLRMVLVSGLAFAAAVVVRAGAGKTHYTFLVILCLCAIPACLLLRLGSIVPRSPLAWFGWLVFAMTGAACASVYLAHRPFPHYLLLLAFPLLAAAAWPLIAEAEPLNAAATPFVLLFATLTAASQIYLAGSPPRYDLMSPPVNARQSRGELIASLTPPGGTVVVWGWDALAYLLAGRIPATRDTNMGNFLRDDTVMNPYYRNRFLSDLRQHPADLIVDTSGPADWGNFKDRKSSGLEGFPEIYAYVQSHYRYIFDGYGSRFYLRNDLPFPAVAQSSVKCAPDAIRCFDGAPGDEVYPLPPVQIPDQAAIDVEFTPMVPQLRLATVFSNDTEFDGKRGVRLEHAGNDRYRLAIGIGTGSVLSKELLVPQRTRAAISVAFHGTSAIVTLNGVRMEEIHLDHRLVDSPGEIQLGNWLQRQLSLVGWIHFFQIRPAATGVPAR